MSDVLYHVRTVYETDTRKGVSGVGGMTGALGVLGGVLGRSVDLVKSLGTAAVMLGTGAAVAGVSALLYGVTELNARSEETGLTIAGMVRAAGVSNAQGGLATWGESMEFAQQAMRQIREDAAALPGTEEDFLTVFRYGLPGALNAGMAAADVSGFTNRFGAVGRAFQIDAPQIGRDLNLLLQGRAGAHVATWNALASHVGKSAQEFNQMTAPQRLAALQGAVTHFDDLIRAYADTWEAQSSTLQSHVLTVGRIFSRPMFDALKESITSVNELYARNEVAIREVAYGAGTVLANAWGRATDRAHEMQEAVLQVLGQSRSLGDVVRNAASMRGGVLGSAVGLADRASGVVGGLASAAAADPAAAASMAGAAVTAAMVAPGLIGAVIAAVGAVPGLGILIGAVGAFAGHATEASETIDHLRAAGEPLMHAFQGVWNVLVGVEGFLGNVLASLLPGVAAGLRGAITGLDGFITNVGPAVGELIAALTPAVTLLGGIIGEIVREMGAELGPLLRNLGSAVGGVLRAFTGLIRWVNEKTGNSEAQGGGWRNAVGDIDSYVGAAIMTGADAIGRGVIMRGMNMMAGLNAGGYDIDTVWRDSLRRQRGWHGVTDAPAAAAATGDGTTPARAAPAGPPLPTVMDRLNDAISGMRRSFEEGQGRASLGGVANPRTVGRHERPVVNVHIHQTVNANEDPERILLLTRRAVMLGIYGPLQSPGVRVTH